MSLSFEQELRLKDKLEKLEQENKDLRKKLAAYENKTSVCYGCGEEIDGPGHDDCDRRW